jgi:hypothetical protein
MIGTILTIVGIVFLFYIFIKTRRMDNPSYKEAQREITTLRFLLAHAEKQIEKLKGDRK